MCVLREYECKFITLTGTVDDRTLTLYETWRDALCQVFSKIAFFHLQHLGRLDETINKNYIIYKYRDSTSIPTRLHYDVSVVKPEITKRPNNTPITNI